MKKVICISSILPRGFTLGKIYKCYPLDDNITKQIIVIGDDSDRYVCRVDYFMDLDIYIQNNRILQLDKLGI